MSLTLPENSPLLAGLLLAVLPEAVTSAQSVPASPAGIFCSCPPTTPTGSVSVMPAVAALPWVRGVLVRVAWKDLAPTPTTFAWGLLDGQILAAQQAGKQVALAIMNGPNAPAWLAGAGAATFSYTFQGNAASMPVPWDPTYLAAWTSFVAALGARYGAESTIALVHVTHATANGFEMQLPFSPTDVQHWQSIGYAESTHVAAWNAVVDAFGAAFPRHALDVECHPVLASDAVANQVFAHGRATIGARFGSFAGWWSENNAHNAYPGMFAVMQDAAATTFAGVQLVASFTQTPSAFSPGGLAGTLDLAIENAIDYVEVWNSDLLNATLSTSLQETAAILASGNLGRAYCFGDGSGTACPCGNASPIGEKRGCANSTGPGARLAVSGRASIAADALVLGGSDMPDSAALYFQGTARDNNGGGTVFGDGLRCAGGSITRLATHANSAGASSCPGPGEPSISVRGAVTSAAVTRTYQVWYRNAAAFCTSSTYNLSNGCSITWQP